LLCSFAPAKKKPNEIPPIDYSYFPVTVGHYVIYDVDSVVYDDFATTDKKREFHFQIKEVIEGKAQDNEGREIQRVVRYKRNNDTSEWKLQHVFTITLTKTTAERFEHNKRYINLVFPASVNKSWKGNSYTQDEQWDYKYTAVGQPATVGSVPVVQHTVTQVDEENLIKKLYSVEKYAKNIGLVYKEFIHDSSKTIDPDVPLMNRIDGGLEYKMTLKSHGHN
jgi:hypothetical protein